MIIFVTLKRPMHKVGPSRTTDCGRGHVNLARPRDSGPLAGSGAADPSEEPVGAREDMEERWALYADVEGFSAAFQESKVDALLHLDALMEAIVKVGDAVCWEFDTRFFAYQTGDGFLLMGDRPGQSVEFPLAIGMCLMQHVAIHGGMAKISIAQGELADIQGCYPPGIRRRFEQLSLRMGALGHMIIFPVMGTALIRAYKQSRAKSGALVLVDSTLVGDLPPGFVKTELPSGVAAIDWVHSRTDQLEELAKRAGILLVPPVDMECHVRGYTMAMTKPDLREWVDNTLTLNGCASSTSCA